MADEKTASPLPDRTPKKVYPLWNWVELRLEHGILDVADDLASFIPLKAALKEKRLALLKAGLSAVGSATPEPPSFTQIEGFPQEVRSFVLALEALTQGKPKAAADITIIGLVDWLNGFDQPGAAPAIVMPVWMADP